MEYHIYVHEREQVAYASFYSFFRSQFMNNPSIRFFILVFYFVGHICAGDDLLSRGYKSLKYWDMRSSGIQQEDMIPVKDSNESQEKKEPNFSFSSIDRDMRRMMFYDILHTQKEDLLAPQAISPDQSRSIEILYRDLEIFCGDGTRPEVSLAGIIDRTRTAAGSVVHRKILTNPLASTNYSKFASRQRLIKALVSQPELLKKADNLCALIAENEERLLANWQEIDSVSNEVFEKSYFKNKYLQHLNTNPVAMELLTRADNMGTCLQLTGDYLGYVLYTAGIGYATEKYFLSNKNASFVQHLYGSIKSTNNVISCFINPIKYHREASALLDEVRAAYDNEVVCGRMTQDMSDYAMKILKGGAYGVVPVCAALYVGFKTYQAKQIVASAKLTRDGINFLQGRLIGLGNLVRSVEALENLGSEYQEVANGLVSWGHIDSLLYRHEEDDFAKLVKLLQTDTFTGEASFFSLAGRILVAHKLAATERDKFAGAIELLGELDACVSAAKLYLQFIDRSVNFCFADIVPARKPHLLLQDFWNPFVDFNVVVPNNLELGGSCSEQHVVLTGSNTGGKSTVGLKGTLISMYLAHIYGLAPATACELSVFSDFSSYIHVTDDVASGESAFQAEINRANSLIKAVKSLQENQFAFIVIDELFKGTSPEKGAPGACKVVRYLANYPNVITITATHFKEMTELEQEIPSIVNMKMEIFEDEAGVLQKPYKLEKGISTHNIADKLMESGLDFNDLVLE